MAGRGKFYTFHGAFGSKERAEARERSRPGAFVQKVSFRRKRKDRKKGKLQTRWLVLKGRKR